MHLHTYGRWLVWKAPTCSSGTHTHTFTIQWNSLQKQFRIQYLSQGHSDMQTGGVGDRTTCFLQLCSLVNLTTHQCCVSSSSVCSPLCAPAGARVNAKDNMWLTPLHRAVASRSEVSTHKNTHSHTHAHTPTEFNPPFFPKQWHLTHRGKNSLQWCSCRPHRVLFTWKHTHSLFFLASLSINISRSTHYRAWDRVITLQCILGDPPCRRLQLQPDSCSNDFIRAHSSVCSACTCCCEMNRYR